MIIGKPLRMRTTSPKPGPRATVPTFRSGEMSPRWARRRPSAAMNAIYEAAEGSRMSHSGGWLRSTWRRGARRHLQVSGGRAPDRGRPEHWGHHTPFMILLTHAGIEEKAIPRGAGPGHRALPPISSDPHGSAIGSPRSVPPAPRPAVSVALRDRQQFKGRDVGDVEARRQPRCPLACAGGAMQLPRTWPQSRFRPACPRRITHHPPGTFSRRVRSSNTATGAAAGRPP